MVAICRTEQEALNIMTETTELLRKKKRVTVEEFEDIAWEDRPKREESVEDMGKFGWTNLADMRVIQGNTTWILDMPRVEQLSE